MSAETAARPRTGQVNGDFWGRQAEVWAEIQEATLLPVFRTVLDRASVGAGTRYLDIGCGSGMATDLAAARGARVSGLDASAALLSVARRRRPEADLRQGDFEALPYDDDAYDVVTGFNSLQYAGTPETALAEARRVTVPGGIISVVTWGPPEGMDAARIVAALRPLMPPPPPDAPGPFALSDESRLRRFAASVGLEDIEIFDIDSPWRYPDRATAVRGLGSSGVAARAAERSGAAAVDAAHAEAIVPFVRPDGSVEIGATFRCLMARA